MSNLDFFNNIEPPKTDGITVYKINSKTHHRVEVGYLVLNGVIRLREPNKFYGKKINVYYPTFKVYSLDDKAQICSKTIKSNVEELLISDTENSIGYFDNTKIFNNNGSINFVFWDQYLN